MNRTAEPTRVIQIWFVADLQYRGMEAHYEQAPLAQMPARAVGDAQVRTIIGPDGATDAHVNARLTSAIVPSGGRTTVELPRSGEDLFLYVVNGEDFEDAGSVSVGRGTLNAEGPLELDPAVPPARD